ncbi:MAG: maleylpyruvate isomerase family mycothiol-dependent enzyme [Acidimicrobiales bacterium]
MTKPTPSDYRHLLRVEAARLSEIGTEHLELDVPHIDGWTVRSVIGHTGWVFRFARLALDADPENPPSRSSVPEPPPGDEVIDWFTVGAAQLQEALDGTNLETPRPTFTGPQPAGWWLRRLSHEVSIHRWDAESAFGHPEPIDARQARDGIDEVLEVFTPQRMQFATLDGNGETVHLHATDIDDGEWFMTYGDEAVEWDHSHAKGDVAARGTVSDLLLLLWSRIPASRLEVFGDASLLDRWQDAATF